jgi:hypothetical protein
MTLRIERDAGFWSGIAAHPDVAPHLGASGAQVAALAAWPGILPLAAEHGGFLFRNLDGLGFVFELHTLFTPEGWGREVVVAAHEAFAMMFNSGVALVVTHERRGWWRSRPPRSHGWALAGDWREAAGMEVRMWTLTRAAWLASASVRRRQCQ